MAKMIFQSVVKTESIILLKGGVSVLLKVVLVHMMLGCDTTSSSRTVVLKKTQVQNAE